MVTFAMASMQPSQEPQAFHFSESQREALRTHYQNGVTSTSQTEKIAQIASEIGVTSEQVKVLQSYNNMQLATLIKRCDETSV